MEPDDGEHRKRSQAIDVGAVRQARRPNGIGWQCQNIWIVAEERASATRLVSRRPRPPRLDGLLGALCALVDESYEGIVRTGFDVPEGTVFGPPPGAGAPYAYAPYGDRVCLAGRL